MSNPEGPPESNCVVAAARALTERYSGVGRRAIISALVATCVSCGSSSEPSATADARGNAEEQSLYALGSLVFNAEGTTSYVSLLSSLNKGNVDLSAAREFAGLADLWVFDESIFVASNENLSITRFEVVGGALEERGSVNFGAYGLTNLGFFLNTFISPSKAYLLNGSSEFIVWNPQTMRVTHTAPLPKFEKRGSLRPFPGYSDRAAQVRAGHLYQPIYWTDDSFFEFDASSQIVVFDTTSDSLIEVLDAPCPGLDYSTRDGEGNLYFSNWVYAAGGAAVLGQTDTCVFRVPAGSEPPHVAFTFSELTGGHQGAAFRVLDDGRTFFSVLYADRPELAGETDASKITSGANWRFWSKGQGNTSASMLANIDWNAGAQYSFSVDGKTYILLSTADYSATDVYAVASAKADLELAFRAEGWSTRLFRVR
ncbi:MAG TPA: hypothetical protein VFQ61_36545 [Polyangiaceae bacterium]|nr:hypothetical protein [Polyangiaceae bacterium]